LKIIENIKTYSLTEFLVDNKPKNYNFIISDQIFENLYSILLLIHSSTDLFTKKGKDNFENLYCSKEKLLETMNPVSMISRLASSP